MVKFMVGDTVAIKGKRSRMNGRRRETGRLASINEATRSAVVDSGVYTYHVGVSDLVFVGRSCSKEVHETCARCIEMLNGIKGKVPTSPHGAGPDGWLENAVRHLQLILEAVK